MANAQSIKPDKTSHKVPLSAFTIIVSFIVLMVVGVFTVPLLSIQLEPSIQSDNTLQVSFNYPEASSEIVEKNITGKLEGILNTLKGVKKISSVSSFGGGVITAELDKGANINQVRYEASTLLKQTYPQLPLKASFPIVSSGTQEDEVPTTWSYTVKGPGSTTQIRKYVEEKISPRIALLEGISNIDIYGGNTLAWELRYNNADLISHSLSGNDITAAINNYFAHVEPGSARFIDPVSKSIRQAYLKVQVDHKAEINWSKIPVKRIEDRTLFLTDLVHPEMVEEEPQSYYRINGQNTVNIRLTALPNMNLIRLANKMSSEITRIENDLPQGYSIKSNYDSTEYLRKEISTITWRSLATICLLLIFVLVFSRKWLYLLLILISLVANLLIAVILYYGFGLQIHLYSLAGITISLGMIIDNSIVVIEHVRYKHNMRVFLAVAGSTFTTLGAVSIIFLLDEKLQENLVDFAWVIILNLLVSLVTAFFFVPALLEKLPIGVPAGRAMIRRKRRIVRWNRFYSIIIVFLARHRKLSYISIILIFGLPLFMLPPRIEKTTYWARSYNYLFKSDYYQERIKPYSDKWLGGTLRLFLNKDEKFESHPNIGRTRISVNITLPMGSTLQQMNHIVLDFERTLAQFKSIEEFQSRVNSGQSAGIDISFSEKNEHSTFPVYLKNLLETKAVFTGLADFQITGIGMGFNNAVNIEKNNQAITIQGFNYDDLRKYAEQIKELLLENPRVEKVSISSYRDHDGENSNYEFVFKVKDAEQLLARHLSQDNINAGLDGLSITKPHIQDIFYRSELTPIFLSPNNTVLDRWLVMNEPIKTDSGAYVRLHDFVSIDKERNGDNIKREDQQYQLVVNYNFIGDDYLASAISEQTIKKVKARLPVGYTVKSDSFGFWTGSEAKLTWAVFYTIAIVFIICAVLLNSILQPLAIIGIIPISFIGVFITSWFFDYRFDEGGYAAFIVLSGVVVNAALYFLNDYNNLLREKKSLPSWKLYLKAYNSKVIPVLLSTASMIVGLIPFILYSRDEPFWYALAMSTIGGLIFSLMAVVLFLPLMLRRLNNGLGPEAKTNSRFKSRFLKRIFAIK